MATFANTRLGGGTAGMSGWGHGTVHMELSRGQSWGRLAASRVRLLAALLHSLKESSAMVSWDRRQQEVSDA